MTTSEKFLHIITVGFWSPYIPDEAKSEFDNFVTKIIKETNRIANDEIDEQTAGDMDEKLNVVIAKFYDLDVEYSIIRDKFFLKHANSQRSELICSPAVQDKLNKEIAPVRIKYALNKFINLRNLRDQDSSGWRSVRLAVKRADDNSQTVKVDFIEYVEHERRMETKEIICSIPEGKIINLSNTHLEKVSLNEADLKNVCLKNAFFLKTHLEGADLEGANMEGAELMYSYFDDSSSLIGA
ncbi:TPA: pentapeptide repeat-containing protein, partial [Escherichia coli]